MKDIALALALVYIPFTVRSVNIFKAKYEAHFLNIPAAP